MAPDSRYDKAKADRAVNFIQCLCHTKGIWAGKKFDLIDWQERIIRDIFGTIKPNGYRQFNTAYVEIPKKQGKQLALDTPLPTPDGWTTMGEIQIGDRVFDEHGKPCTVVCKSAVDDTETAYRITWRDGSSIVAGARHQWNVELQHTGLQQILTTEQIYERQTAQREKRSCIRIPVTGALDMPDADLPLDPYTFGFWLGDGTDQTVSDDRP